jgi:hypothetical protein
MKRERTRRSKVITTVAVVLGVALVVVTVFLVNGRVDPAQREAIGAQKCWNATYALIDANIVVLGSDAPVKVAEFKGAKAALRKTANVGKNGDYGKFAQGLTGAEFCRQLRQLFLDTDKVVRELPPREPPSPSPSASASPPSSASPTPAASLEPKA